MVYKDESFKKKKQNKKNTPARWTPKDLIKTTKNSDHYFRCHLITNLTYQLPEDRQPTWNSEWQQLIFALCLYLVFALRWLFIVCGHVGFVDYGSYLAGIGLFSPDASVLRCGFVVVVNKHFSVVVVTAACRTWAASCTRLRIVPPSWRSPLRHRWK